MPFNHERAFVHEGASQEITRGKSLDGDHIVAEFTFAINDEDRSQLAIQVPEANNARWFAVRKTASGKIFSQIYDSPKRDLTVRRKLASDLRIIANSVEILPTNPNYLFTEDSPLAKVLASEDESLNDDQLRLLSRYVEFINEGNSDEYNSTLQRFAEQLSELITHENHEHPEATSKSILRERCPRILFFSDEDRNLLSDYDLISFFKAPNQQQRPAPIPSALQNLIKTANLDLEELYAAQSKKDQGQVRTLLKRANSTLSKRLQDTWKQSNLSVEIDLNQRQLSILIGPENGDYVKISERSDGLRQFVALLMFLSQEPDLNVAPVVLVDEAEMHLHYDAQADLIQMFTRQNAASKIIYTTHSIGCLPEDLGAVRMIAAADDHFSNVINWFWDSDIPGFSTLLFGMGANTLAFVPMRYAVIAEGAADMILLPALLKTAIGKDELGFQIAPGLSMVNNKRVAIIDNQSPRTAYLVDTDEGGDNIRGQILAAGVSEKRVIALPRIHGSNMPTVLEDFVDPESYLRAVNEELKLSHSVDFQVTIEDIDGPNTSKQLEIWCKSKGIKPPSKRAVAYRLIEDQYKYHLVRSSTTQQLCELYKSIRHSLRLDEMQ